MTVQELIEELQKVEDKGLVVVCEYFEGPESCMVRTSIERIVLSDDELCLETR